MSRQVCHQCQRPLSVCWCACIRPLNHQGKVIIWQHPNEAGHPKGTAALLKHCLAHCEIWVGETATINDLGIAQESTMLVYPDSQSNLVASCNGAPSEQNQTSSALKTPNAIGDQSLQPTKNNNKTLLLIDGTWRKSRKIYYCNTWLQQIPKLNLQTANSLYSIRKAESSHQLSTFEAACLALYQQGLMSASIHLSSTRVFASFIHHLKFKRPKQEPSKKITKLTRIKSE